MILLTWITALASIICSINACIDGCECRENIVIETISCRNYKIEYEDWINQNLHFVTTLNLEWVDLNGVDFVYQLLMLMPSLSELSLIKTDIPCKDVVMLHSSPLVQFETDQTCTSLSSNQYTSHTITKSIESSTVTSAPSSRMVSTQISKTETTFLITFSSTSQFDATTHTFPSTTKFDTSTPQIKTSEQHFITSDTPKHSTSNTLQQIQPTTFEKLGEEIEQLKSSFNKLVSFNITGFMLHLITVTIIIGFFYLIFLAMKSKRRKISNDNINNDIYTAPISKKRKKLKSEKVRLDDIQVQLEIADLPTRPRVLSQQISLPTTSVDIEMNQPYAVIEMNKNSKTQAPTQSQPPHPIKKTENIYSNSNVKRIPPQISPKPKTSQVAQNEFPPPPPPVRPKNYSNFKIEEDEELPPPPNMGDLSAINFNFKNFLKITPIPEDIEEKEEEDETGI